MPFERITVRNLGPPAPADINSELRWIGAVLGLFGERDRDSSCFRVFVTIVKAQQGGNDITSDDIAQSCQLSRGTVVHHLNKLRDAGLVRGTDHGYTLSAETINDAISSIEREINDLLALTRAVAQDIDKKLRL